VNEKEWLVEEDVYALLDHVAHTSVRKSRLFALACYQRAREYCAFRESRELALVVQRFVDEKATSVELDEAKRRLWNAIEESPVPDWVTDAREYRTYRYWPDKIPLRAAEDAVDTFAVAEAAIYIDTEHPRPEREEAELHPALAAVVRDLFGNPFRPVTLDPALLGWNNEGAPRLAQSIYDEEAFDRLGELADTLAEAGCTNREVLDHCRSAGPHVRGCWVVDLLLGKS